MADNIPSGKADDEDVTPEQFIEKVNEAEEIKPPLITSAFSLVAQTSEYHEPVIDGLLRRQEIMTLVSTSKRGKTWAIIHMALSLATGRPWFGHVTKRSRVLVIDSELHPATTGMRLKVVAQALNIDWREVGDYLSYMNLRGRLQDITQIGKEIAALDISWDAIIFDPLYRLYPQGMQENDNHMMASLYNTIDGIAQIKNACVVLVHHPTKSNQSAKDIVEVGAGAGSMTRATDSHLIFRQHEDPDGVVMEAITRTFPQPEAKCMRWRYPIWEEAPDLDPGALAGLKRKGKAAPGQGPTEEKEPSPKEFSDKVLNAELMTVKEIQTRAKIVGWDYKPHKVREILQSASISGFVETVTGAHGAHKYRLVSATLREQPSPPEPPASDSDDLF